MIGAILNFFVLLARFLLWLVGAVAWSWLVFGINAHVGLAVLVITPFVLLAVSRTRHQRASTTVHTTPHHETRNRCHE
jgi:hypothetical protein